MSDSMRKKQKEEKPETEIMEPEQSIKNETPVTEIMEPEQSVEDETPEMTEQEIQLAEQTKLANGYLAQLQRVQADFENYQKRIEVEKGKIADLACGEFITGLLETLDNFDRALQSLEKIPSEEAEGVKMVYQSMMDYLESRGLKKVEATGCQFDPHKHEAVMQQESEDEEGTVLEEFQSGYTLKGKVIRPSKVKVAKSKEDENEK